RLNDANEVFSRATDAMNDVGLMAEEYDPRSGEMLGNFPQGFSHLTLITAALAIDDAEHKAAGRTRSTSPKSTCRSAALCPPPSFSACSNDRGRRDNSGRGSPRRSHARPASPRPSALRS